MPRSQFSFVFIVCFSAAACLAADSASDVGLTLSEALRRANANNPALIAQGFHERAAEARIEQAGLRPNPTLDVMAENIAGTGALRGVDGLETTVQASQTLERGDKRLKRLALARSDRDAAAREFAVRRTEVLSATALAYVETLAAQRRVALAAEPLTLARDTIASAEARVKEGMGSPAELARARAALAGAKAEHARAESALISARAALAAAWAGEPDDVPELSGTLPTPDNLPSPEAFLGKLPLHPRLALQESLVATQRAALDLERAQSVQDVTVGGGVRFLRDGSDAALVAGVSIPLPFRNRNQGNIRAARELLAGAEQGTRVVEIELRTAFAVAWREAQAAHAAAQELRRDALPATEEATALVRRAYDEGHLPLIDVIDAQRELVAIRREILDAETACALALVRAEGVVDTTFPFTTSLLSSR